ncbi:MAG: DUF72 domain-containing protein [Polyangiaceae bacterium]
MTRHLVGLAQMRGKLSNYAERFDMVELCPVDQPLPGPKKLRNWRQQVPPAFVFSVVLPSVVASLQKGPEADKALRASLEAARALEARCIVLITPPSVRPTKANRKRIVELAARLPQEGHVLAWEARGIWEPLEATETAYEAGLLPIFDATQFDLPRGPIAYTRIKTLGFNNKLSAGHIDVIAAQIEGRQEAYIVVQGAGGGKLRSVLKTSLERARQDGSAIPTLFRPDASLLADDEEQ